MLFYILSIFQKVFDFRGRSTRTEYWTFNIVMTVIIVCFWVSIKDHFETDYSTYYITLWSFSEIITDSVLLIMVTLSISVRRLHDFNKSGYWLFLHLIPFVGQIILFIWSLQPSTNGKNTYGDEPESDDVKSLIKRFG